MDLVPHNSNVVTVIDEHEQQGIYDKPVEVWRGGQLVRTYMSYIRVGEPFHFMDKDTWYVCATPIQQTNRWSKNPTFIIGAFNVLQASPIEERMQKAQLENKPQPKRLAFDKSDVSDVEIKGEENE